MLELHKLAKETDNEYIYRICAAKDQIGTWDDVADVINKELGQDKDECVYRKNWKAFNILAHASETNLSDAQQILGEIKEQRRELEKEKVKLRDERNEVSRLMRVQARGESMRELIERRFSAYKPETFEHIGVVSTEALTTDLIVHLTDLHAGVKIENLYNSFDQQVLRARLKRYAEKVYVIQQRHNGQNCFLVLGGDLVNGEIHLNNRLENNENVVDQVISAGEAVSWFVAELSRMFEHVYIYSVPGNHSRVFPAKEDNQHGEYLDKLVTYIVDARCAALGNVETYQNTIDETIADFMVRGRLVYAVHGDKDTPGSVVQTLTMMTSDKPDIVLMGHRHTNALTTVYDTKVYESGCVDGADCYCMDKRLRNKPEQNVLVVNAYGVDCCYDITLD